MMGLFSRLFSKPAPAVPLARLWLEGSGTFALEIVGEASYEPALETICGGRTDESVNLKSEACLICEDSNPYDSMAVRVDIGGHTVGYLSRDNARRYRQELQRIGYPKQQAFCSAVIRGGWDRGSRGRGHFGVWLDLPAS
jgi:hypothetical protein